MPVLSLDVSNLTHFRQRIARLSDDSQRRWGSMDVAQMLNHVRTLILVSLEERTLPNVSNWFSRTALARWMVLAMPWPGGKIKAPIDIRDGEIASFEEERQMLEDAVVRFAERATAHPQQITISPLVGPIPLCFWAKLHGKHLDHHLRQFGC